MAELKDQVQDALEEIRPFLQADGGDVELVEITPEKVVLIKMQGACGGCPMSQMTLKAGIEERVRERVPEIVAVEAV